MSKCSISHNIFKYMVFQRRQKVLSGIDSLIHAGFLIQTQHCSSTLNIEYNTVDFKSSPKTLPCEELDCSFVIIVSKGLSLFPHSLTFNTINLNKPMSPYIRDILQFAVVSYFSAFVVGTNFL